MDPPLLRTLSKKEVMDMKSRTLLQRLIFFHDKRCTPSFIRKTVHDQPETLNGRNITNCTTLHFAVFYSNFRFDIIYELLCLGADLHAIDDYGFNPLHCTVLMYFHKLENIIRNLSKRNLQYLETNYHNLFYEDELLNSPIEALKLLLEFGAEPDTRILKLFVSFDQRFSLYSFTKNFTYKMWKVLLQFMTFTILKNDLSSSKSVMPLDHYHNILKNDLVYPYCVGDSDEMESYRDNLINELFDMMKEKINENSTLFTFVSERYSSGIFYPEVDASLIVKVLSIFHSKKYIYSCDLIDASLKRKELLSCLYELDIHANIRNYSRNSHVSKKLKLDYPVMLSIGKYLPKEDIINLIFAHHKKGDQKQFFLKSVKIYSLINMKNMRYDAFIENFSQSLSSFVNTMREVLKNPLINEYQIEPMIYVRH